MNPATARPPRLGYRLMALILGRSEHYALLADFDELYLNILKKNGRTAALFWYGSQVLRFFPAYFRHSLSVGSGLFKNYCLTGLRALKKQKVHAFINVFGLALGLAACLLIFFFVADEYSFDRFQANEKSVFRVMSSFREDNGGLGRRGPSMPLAAGPLLKDFFPEIKNVVRFGEERGTVRVGDRIFNESITFTDPAVFQVFSFRLLRGDPASVLLKGDDLVLTESAARKFFGNADPLGKTVTITLGTGPKDLIVSGVSADPPRNSTIRYQFLSRVENIILGGYREALTNLGDFSYPLFVQLQSGVGPERIESRMNAFLGQSFAAEFARWGRRGKTGEGFPIALDLQGLRKMHFDPQASDSADLSGVLILAGIGLIILFIACLNFINLAIGRASLRVAEIGMRKVIGAGRRQLLSQFLSEALILVVVAFLVGIVLAALFMPTFSRLSGKGLVFGDFIRPAHFFGYAALLLAVAAAVGGYPALVMARVKPVQAFRGRTGRGNRRRLTRTLVLIQFAFSVFLIVSTIVLGRQIRFMTEKDPGYAREGLVSVRLPTWQAEKSLPIIERFRERAGSIPGVVKVSGVNVSLGRGSSQVPLKQNGLTIPVYQFRVDPEYIPTMGLRLFQGRNFSSFQPSDADAAVVNRAFCRELGITNPIGRRIGEFSEGSPTDYPNKLEIIGIVEDYNVLSFKHDLQPVLLHMQPGWGMGQMLVRIRTSGVAETLTGMETVWRELLTDKPFAYSFLVDDLASQYAAEIRWKGIVGNSTVFAVLIACLGVFGLTSLAVTRRFKEIGIRKVLGADFGRIFALVTKEIVLLVAAANLIAGPVVYFALKNVLNRYHYRIPIGPRVFLAAAALSLAVALATVSYLAIKASLFDPVKAIRGE
jgi:putative ABC transport system permease protein